MLDPDFSPRRLYEAVRSSADQMATADPGDWQERSSPVALGNLDDWQWSWFEGASDGNGISSDRPRATLTFPFRGAGVSVRVLTGPDHGTALVELDGRVNGQTSEISTAGSETQWQWVELATGLGDGEHALSLATLGDGVVVIDAFRVDAGEPADLGEYQPLGLSLLAAGLLIGLLIDIRAISKRLRL
jgi:hypothetical protein